MSLAPASFSSALLASPAALPYNFPQFNTFNPIVSNSLYSNDQNGFNFNNGYQSGSNFNNGYQNYFNSFQSQPTNNLGNGNQNGFDSKINNQPGFNFHNGYRNGFQGNYNQQQQIQESNKGKGGTNKKGKGNDKEAERKKQNVQDMRKLIIMMGSFFLLDKQSAAYFGASELFSVFLEKLGVPDAANMLILLFVQCVDVVALSRGRFKFVEGYEVNWYQELYENALTQLRLPPSFVYGSQLFLPQSPKPTYEE